VEGDGRKEQFGYISLKHAAEITGFVFIGKKYLLTNPQYDNLLWFSAVLTDADLMSEEKVQYAHTALRITNSLSVLYDCQISIS